MAEELREARVAAGLSQAAVASAARMDRGHYCRVEAAEASALTIRDAARLGAVLGLDLVARLYPGGSPLRDAAHVSKLARVQAAIGPPLRWRTEVPLPRTTDHFEPRAWDATIVGGGERTTIELEMRLRDGQAVERRLALKRRDDPPDRFLLIVAATRTNRRALADGAGLFPDLPRLRTANVLAALARGEHPPTGLMLL